MSPFEVETVDMGGKRYSRTILRNPIDGEILAHTPWNLTSHFEVSPKEREDEDRRHRRDFDTDEQDAEDLDDRIRRSQEGVPDED